MLGRAATGLSWPVPGPFICPELCSRLVLPACTACHVRNSRVKFTVSAVPVGYAYSHHVFSSY